MAQRIRKTITEIVDQSIKPLARAAGFKKKGFNFHRRKNDLIQVVNIQLSQYNFGDVGGFYINLGIAFDKLIQLEGTEINERLPEYQCHFRRRIADFCPDSPDCWDINEATDISAVISKATNCFKIVLEEFDHINSIETLLERDLLRSGSEFGLLARLYYVLGNLDAARQAIQHEAEFFADRGISVPELIDRYNLSELKGAFQ